MITRNEWTWPTFCRAFNVKESDLIHAINSRELKARRIGALMILDDVGQASNWLNKYRRGRNGTTTEET